MNWQEDAEDGTARKKARKTKEEIYRCGERGN